MIRINASIRGSLILAFATVALILVTGYSFLSARYFIDGMDTIIADNLIRAANAAASNNKRLDVNIPDNYTVTREWSDHSSPQKSFFATQTRK